MRTLLLASATVLFVGGTALAQNSNSPASSSATNISAGTTRSAVAPRLPGPASDTSADQYLNHAQSALRRGHTGEAQEALERAETRLLDRSTPRRTPAPRTSDPGLQAISSRRARRWASATAAAAMQSIQAAMSSRPPASSATHGHAPTHHAQCRRMGNARWHGHERQHDAGRSRDDDAARRPARRNQSPNVPPNSLGGIATRRSAGDNGCHRRSTNPLRMPPITGPNYGTAIVPNPPATRRAR